jgi:hypothetical protein
MSGQLGAPLPSERLRKHPPICPDKADPLLGGCWPFSQAALERRRVVTVGLSPESPPTSPGGIGIQLPPISRHMPNPDRANIRRAVDQFQPQRRRRFHNLVPWDEEIVALRDKGASCEAIAELLTQHGVKTSRTMVAEYLSAQGAMKPRRKTKVRPFLDPNRSDHASQPTAEALVQPEFPARREEADLQEPQTLKSKGPRIARVELIKSTES